MLAVRKISAALLLPASIVLTGVWGALHLAPRGDLAGMISAGAGPYAELAEHLARLSATRQLVVSVERKTAPEQLARWVAELRGLDAVRRVDSQSLGLVDPEARQLGRQLFEARFALLEPQQALELPLRRYLRQLSLPLVADERMAVDPLGDRQRLQRRIAGPLATTSDWTLLSLTLSHPPAEIARTEALLDVLLSMRRRGAPHFTISGPHVTAYLTASGIRRDVWVASTVTLALIGCLYGFVFRRLRPIIQVAVPVVVGIAGALAAVSLVRPTLHGLGLAFGVLIVGVGIDYGTHLVIYQRYRARNGDPETPAARLAWLRGRLLRTAGLGALTTVTAFATLAWADAQLLRDLALLVACGVAVTFLIAVVSAPHWARPNAESPDRLAGVEPQQPSDRHRQLHLLAVALLGGYVVISLIAIPRAKLQGDLRQLERHTTSDRWADLVDDRRGYPRVIALAVVDGADLQATLQRGDALRDRLLEAERLREIGGFVSALRVVPSIARQRANLAGYSAEYIRRVVHVGAGVGLSAQAFAPFRRALVASRRSRPWLRPALLRATPLAPLLTQTLFARQGGYRALAVIYGVRSATSGPDSPALLRHLESLPGVSVISLAETSRTVVESIRRQSARLLALAGGLVFLLLLCLMRSLRFALLALLPVGVGVTALWGTLVLLGQPINIVTIGALPLVVGMGVDYGIFGVFALRHPEDLPVVRRSVPLAAATTAFAFVGLAFAESPALRSLGLAVALGVVFCAIAALSILPLFARRSRCAAASLLVCVLGALSLPSAGCWRNAPGEPSARAAARGGCREGSPQVQLTHQVAVHADRQTHVLIGTLVIDEAGYSLVAQTPIGTRIFALRYRHGDQLSATSNFAAIKRWLPGLARLLAALYFPRRCQGDRPFCRWITGDRVEVDQRQFIVERSEQRRFARCYHHPQRMTVRSVDKGFSLTVVVSAVDVQCCGR